jgi:hypothetical protein
MVFCLIAQLPDTSDLQDEEFHTWHSLTSETPPSTLSLTYKSLTWCCFTGPAAGDQEEEDEDSDLSGDGDDSDGGFDVMQGLRAGRAAELAAMFGAGR